MKISLQTSLQFNSPPRFTAASMDKKKKEWSGTIEELEHKRDRLQEKLQRVMAEHAQADTVRRNLYVQVQNKSPNLIDEMKVKIDSDQGKRVYGRRLGIVEPVFSNICVQKRMHRFTLRSKRKVDVQWRLFVLVHNIGKIHSLEGNSKPEMTP